MAVFKVHKTQNYTVMSNYHLREKNMSMKAKGLLSVMLSLPQDWDYSISGLCALGIEKETAITAMLNELKEFGYLVVQKIYPNKENGGRIEYIYNIYEQPQKQEGKKQGLENQGLVGQGVETQGVEDIGLYNNTNKQNTNEQSIDINNIYINTSGQVGGQSIGQQGGHKVDICPPLNTSNNLLSVNEVLELAKTHCQVLYDRFQRKIDEKGQVHLYDTLQNVLDEIGRYYTIEQLKELFIKASKLYCSTPNYSNLDLLWLLNNLKKIEDTPIRESTSGGDNNSGETKQKGYWDDFLDSIGRLE